MKLYRADATNVVEVDEDYFPAERHAWPTFHTEQEAWDVMLRHRRNYLNWRERDLQEARRRIESCERESADAVARLAEAQRNYDARKASGELK